MNKQKNYNTKEASEYLGELGIKGTPGTLEVWRHFKRGPAYIKILGRIYYPEANLDEFAKGEPVKTIDSIHVAA